MCNASFTYVCLKERKMKTPTVCFFKQWHDQHFFKFILQEKTRQIGFHDMEKCRCSESLKCYTL